MNDEIYKIDYEAVRYFASDSLQFHSLEMSRFSGLFISQIKHLHEDRIICTYQIMDEIKWMENGSCTSYSKKAEKFKHPPLAGLWKKHFPSPYYILRNINIQNKFDLFSEAMDLYVESEIAKGKTIDEISHALTVESFMKRAKSKKNTGEWIIFAKFEEKNYYLTLAAHSESDYSIFERISRYCKIDFPFIPELSTHETH